MKIKLAFQQYDRMVENIKKTDMQPEGFWPTGICSDKKEKRCIRWPDIHI